MTFNEQRQRPAPNRSFKLGSGVLGLQAGDFTRPVGTGDGEVNLVNNGGFAASAANRAVNLGGEDPPAQLTMGNTGFFDTTNTFALSHATADATVDIQNPIALRNGTNFFQVADGAAVVDAKFSGVISSPNGGTGFSKTGNGTLVLSNTGNSFNQVFIDSGTIMLGADDVLPGGGLTVKTVNNAIADGTLDLN